MDMSIEHFKNLWHAVVEEFGSLCKTWECVCEEENVPEDVLGEIRTVIGLAKLLKEQKLKQFRGLIDDSEFKRGEKEITLIDLQGFWDMVYNEVEKIQKSFKKLDDCKNNDWKFVEEKVEKIQTKKVIKAVSMKKTNTSNTHSEAARQRLAEIKKKLKAQQQKENIPQKTSALTDVLVVECKPSEDSNKAVEMENSKEDTPSPSKIAKKESSNTIIENKPKKTSKINAIPKKNAKKPEKSSSVQKKSSQLKQDKENTPVNVHVANTKKLKENEDVQKIKNPEEFQRRYMTRYAKRVLLAQQEAVQKS